MTNLVKQKSYFRTLVFTIIATLISFALIAVIIFVPQAKQYTSLIVTIEVGLFLITIYCIRQVILKEKQFQQLSDPKNYVVNFDDCPDYFNRKYDEASRKFYCSNEYIVQHPIDSAKQAIMKLMLYDPTDTTIQFPNYHSNEYMNTQSGTPSKPIPSEKFYPEVFLDKSLTDNIKRCNLVDDSNVIEVANDPIENRKEFKKLPWTSVRSRCNGLYARYL
jgi:hypothetical protein